MSTCTKHYLRYQTVTQHNDRWREVPGYFENTEASLKRLRERAKNLRETHSIRDVQVYTVVESWTGLEEAVVTGQRQIVAKSAKKLVAKKQATGGTAEW